MNIKCTCILLECLENGIRGPIGGRFLLSCMMEI